MTLDHCQYKPKKEQVMNGLVGLIVDDEAGIRHLFKHLLEQHDFRVAVAASAEEGLDIAERVLPDFVITDHNMPGMTGIQLCGELRKSDATRETPIIMISGSGLQDDDFPEGCKPTRLISKPVSLATLLKAVQDVVEEME